MKRPLPYLVAALVAGLFLSACGAGTEPPAATVDSRSISRSSFEDELRVLGENKKFVDSLEKQGSFKIVPIKNTILPDISSQWLNLLLNQEIIDREFERRDLQVTPEQQAQGKAEAERVFGGAEVFAAFPQRFQNEMIGRNARVAALAAELPTFVPTEADLRKYFRENASRSCPGKKYLERIVVPTEQEAQDIKTQLQQGADFKTLARARSTDAASAPLGGIMFCVLSESYGQAEQPIKDAAVALSAGLDPNPVRTSSGYEIIRFGDWTFENIRPLVEQQYATQGETPLSRFLNRELVRSALWIDPRYGRLGRNGRTVIVETPSAPELKERPTTPTTLFSGIPNP